MAQVMAPKCFLVYGNAVLRDRPALNSGSKRASSATAGFSYLSMLRQSFSLSFLRSDP